ncbi:uncharacterized protein LOC144010915 [Festucalex cinctus]
MLERVRLQELLLSRLRQTSVDAVLNISTFNTEPRELTIQLRETVNNFSLPLNITVDLILTSLNLTTVCFREFNGQEQCQCEDDYLWPCGICETYGACSNISLQSCNCINGIPSVGQFCERDVNTTCPLSSTTPPSTTPSETETETETSVDAVLNISTFNTEPRELTIQLRETVNNFSLPLNITVDLILTSLNLTTVCFREFNGQEQCQCEDDYLWPCGICETYGACSNISLQSCNCINGIPSVGQFCERDVNTTCPLSSTTPPSTTPSETETETETSVDAVLNISTFNTEPRELTIQLRETVNNFSLPLNITVDLILTSLNLTTVCFREFNGQEQCQCEDDYLWPCGICETYGACSNISLQSCNCINGIPSDGQFCERDVNTTCPLSSTTPPSTTPSETETETETETSVDAVLNISTFNTEPRELTIQLRETVNNFSLPLNITVDLILTSLNLTTVCFREFNGQEQCQCEDDYLWPCGICETYGACSNISLQSCNCINGIPSDGQFCERDVNTTCPLSSTTPPSTTPSETETETSVDAVLNISTFNTEPRELTIQLRETVNNFSLPLNITVDLILTSLNLTTVCFREFNGQEQCQCEDDYLWPCGICETYGACSNISLQSCNCIHGIPSDGQFCERDVNTTCPLSSTTPPSTTPSETETETETSVDAVLNISTFNTEPRELTIQLRETVNNFSLPLNITVDLILTSLNLTTVCFREFNGQEQCQCEDDYLWPCGICETYGSCSNISLQSCNCINGIPSDGQFCERDVNTTCPLSSTTPPSTTPSETETETSVDAVLNISTFNTEPRELTIQLRETVNNFSLPLNITVDLILTSLNLTTVCFREFNGQEQCQCEDDYLWPCGICETYGACSNISLQSCNCIHGIPSDGQFCERDVNTTCPLSSTTPPSTTPSETETETETSVDAVLNISTFNTEPRELTIQLRETVNNFSLPLNITVDLILTSLNLTTVCFREFNGQEQCQCEDDYLWPCGICETYGACSNISLQSCNCINGIPSDGQFCERDVNTTCPLSSTTPPSTTPSETETETETSVDAVLNISTFNTEPRELTIQLRETVNNFSLPLNITVDLILTSLNLTTVCFRGFNGQEQCQCEDDYLWPCGICETYGACSNISLQSCNCINGIPSDGQFCERDVNTTCPLSSTTPPSTTPSETETETSVDAVLNISTFNTEPRELTIQLRETVNNFSLPLNITVDLILTSLNLTTACFRDFNGQEQCQCEDDYLWPCGICETYGACSNISLQSCNCINGIPSDGQFCERDVNTTCPLPSTTPPSTPPSTTPPATTASTTPPATTASTSPLSAETSVDAVLSMRASLTEPRELIIHLREAIENITLPFTVTVDLILTSLILTTACYRDFNGQEQCQCEDEYLWPCDICETYGACSNTSMQNCDCINGIPSDGQYCELGVNTICPPTTSTTPSSSSSSSSLTTTAPSSENLPTDIRTIDVRPLSLTMEFDFDESYNDENNGVYQRCFLSIQTQSRIHIPELLSSELLGFRFGSTVMDFEITANTTIQDEDVDALLAALFNDLRIDFPIRFDSRRNLTFQPRSVFFDNSLNVTCGPTPEDLEFRITSTEWTRDDVVIIEDIRHRFSRTNGTETLTITNYFFTDDGRYQCQLFDGEASFLQESNKTFSLLETPIVQTVPLQNMILCEAGQQVPIQCSVQGTYQVRFKDIPNTETGPVIQQLITVTQDDCDKEELIVTCEVVEFSQFSRNITLRLINDGTFTCEADPDFGNGFLNELGRASCETNDVGLKTAICRSSGEWENREDNCTLQRIAQLLIQSALLTEQTLAEFLEELRNTTLELSDQVTQSPNNIEAIVRILNNVANFVTTFVITISQDSMEDILFVTDVLTRDAAREAWDTLNFEAVIESIDPRTITPRNESVSSILMFALERITRRLVNASFGIETPLILLNKTMFTNSFNEDFNSSVEIDIQETNGATNLTVITFESLDNVLPPRDENNSSGRVINGRVVLVQSDTIIDNVNFTFDIVNDSLGNPQCVFWNFSLFGGLGGWDDEGCELVREDETVTCQCDHLTSFSMLMSPLDIISRLLDFITYIGVGISMASLVICLIIEGFILTKVGNNATSYLRHVSIVNIAVCLLIADIWFIVGASISEEPRERRNPQACTAATFFIHFFYLALFFWMLASALLLFYRLVWIFGGRLSTKTMLAIGFCLGYGVPLLIAVITIAVTAPTNAYIRENVICWLNWERSRALLAFVIPALVIVFINILILIVVTVKIVQSRGMTINAQDDEKYVLVVIIRSLAILTPFFGITWGLGIGILIDPTNLGIHIAFAFFNSLQGFFILVFGTLLDRKVRSEIATFTSSQIFRSGTRTTSTGTSSSGWKIRNRGRRGGNISSDISSSQAINT